MKERAAQRCPCCNRRWIKPEIREAIKAATNVREAARMYKVDRRTVQRIKRGSNV